MIFFYAAKNLNTFENQVHVVEVEGVQNFMGAAIFVSVFTYQ